MSRVLRTGNIKPVSAFFAHHQNIHNSVLFCDIEEDAIIPEAKFPGRDWVDAEPLDAPRFLHRLMTKVKFDAIKNDSLDVSLEPIEMPESLIRDLDGERLRHRQAQNATMNTPRYYAPCGLSQQSRRRSLAAGA
jgi:hypothetical protein